MEDNLNFALGHLELIFGMQHCFDQTRWNMEDNPIFSLLEDNLNFSLIKDDLNFFWKRKTTLIFLENQFFDNWRQLKNFENHLNFL
jgi:hypothetical protein